MSGVFILTLPIPIVVNSFGNFYKDLVNLILGSIDFI